MKRICVYCGSSDQIPGPFLKAGRLMGETIAEREFDLVYGGGGTGIMAEVAEGALSKGARVIGVINEAFNTPTLVHGDLSELRVVETMYERKAMMIDMSDAFVALPGGFGTMDELFEVLTMAQVGFHHLPVGLLNVNGFFDPLIAYIDHLESEGFLYHEHPSLLLKNADPNRLIDQMIAYQPPDNLDRWMTRPEEA